jgi:2-polyprenyl-3-methyl-5-hydroxy-6-metoxy-1,4-benzoquinol methylase
LSSSAGGPILDVGCGTGLLRARLERVPFTRYVGIDPVEDVIERAGPPADERAQFVVGDLLTAELGAFDLVVSNELLYGVRDPFALIDRLEELVRPGGHLVTSMMRHDGDRQLWRRLDESFDPVDAVEVRNRANRRAFKGWRVALHRRR